jgi:K+-transporting ATPase A subunit
MLALVIHNFTSAAVGIALAAALVRGWPAIRPRRWAISGSIWCA